MRGPKRWRQTACWRTELVAGPGPIGQESVAMLALQATDLREAPQTFQIQKQHGRQA